MPVMVFWIPVEAAVGHVNQAVSNQDDDALLAALRLKALALLGVQDSNCRWYLEHFTTYCQHKSKVYCLFVLLSTQCLQGQMVI